MKEQTGKNLRTEWEEYRLSQIFIATETGINPSKLSRIAKGWVEPRPDEYIRIRKVLDRFKA